MLVFREIGKWRGFQYIPAEIWGDYCPTTPLFRRSWYGIAMLIFRETGKWHGCKVSWLLDIWHDDHPSMQCNVGIICSAVRRHQVICPILAVFKVFELTRVMRNNITLHWWLIIVSYVQKSRDLTAAPFVYFLENKHCYSVAGLSELGVREAIFPSVLYPILLLVQIHFEQVQNQNLLDMGPKLKVSAKIYLDKMAVFWSRFKFMPNSCSFQRFFIIKKVLNANFQR